MKTKSWWNNIFSLEKAIPENEGESVLRQIWNEYNLIHTEGEFESTAWLRKPASYNPGQENDIVITDFAGMSVSYDVITKDYELALPIKFRASFKYEVKVFIAARYNVTNFKDTGYTAVISFKTKTI